MKTKFNNQTTATQL